MSQKNQNNILIVSSSGRALAESAKRAGYQPVVLDAFCDLDTQNASVFCSQVAFSAKGAFDSIDLLNQFKHCINQFGDTLVGWIAGSGFEAINDTLLEMANTLLLLGNSPQIYQHSKNDLKIRLAELGVPCLPKIQELPHLIKPSNEQGGVNIRFDNIPSLKQAEGDTFTETYLAGTPISHLFLATGNQVETVGWSTQWHSKHNIDHPFCYGGAVNAADLSKQWKEKILHYSLVTSKTLGLKGLNNMDYLKCGDDIYFLELNPRISASFSLFDEDYAKGLLDAHIRACQGELVSRQQALHKAQAVIYAAKDVQIDNRFIWSSVVKDRPKDMSVRASHPVCSIIMQSKTMESSLSLLQYEIRNLLNHLSLNNKVSIKNI